MLMKNAIARFALQVKNAYNDDKNTSREAFKRLRIETLGVYIKEPLIRALEQRLKGEDIATPKALIELAVEQDLQFLLRPAAERLSAFQLKSADHDARDVDAANPIDMIKDAFWQGGTVTEMKKSMAVLQHVINEFRQEMASLGEHLDLYVESRAKFFREEAKVFKPRGKGLLSLIRSWFS